MTVARLRNMLFEVLCYCVCPVCMYTRTRMIPVRHSRGPLWLTLTQTQTLTLALTLTPGMADLRNGGHPEWGGGGTTRTRVHSA